MSQFVLPAVASEGVINWPFLTGFMLGQFSVGLVLLIFVRFFIFSDQTEPDINTQRRTAKVLPTGNPSTDAILEKTYYNTKTHQPESLDWFSVLVAQALYQLRDEVRGNDEVLERLNEILKSDKLPGFLDTINVVDLDIGDAFPQFGACKVNKDESGDLEAEIKVSLEDTIKLGVETKMLLNFPIPKFASVPVSLSVSLVKFSGTLTVAIRSAFNSGEANRVLVSFAPDYELQWKIESSVGSTQKLQNAEKISRLIESRIRRWFKDRCVYPEYQQFELPKLWRKTSAPPPSSAGGGTAAGSSASGVPASPFPQPANPSSVPKPLELPGGFPHRNMSMNSQRPNMNNPKFIRSMSVNTRPTYSSSFYEMQGTAGGSSGSAVADEAYRSLQTSPRR